MLGLLALIGSRSVAAPSALTRAECDRQIVAIQDEWERAKHANDWNGMSEATDQAIAVVLRLRDPASLSVAGWYAIAEVAILLSEREFARAAARGNKHFDYIVQWPDAPTGMASNILECEDASPNLLALAARLQDWSACNAQN